MDFSFSRDQLLFQDNVRSFLINEVTPERIRELWLSDSGRSERLWAQLVELGLTALTVPEAQDGMGMNELDFVLIAQECGYAGLPEPLVDTMLVGVPLLAALDEQQATLKQYWLSRVAEGNARLAVGEPGNRWSAMPMLPICCCWPMATRCMHWSAMPCAWPATSRSTRAVSCSRSSGRQRPPPASPVASKAGVCGRPPSIVAP